ADLFADADLRVLAPGSVRCPAGQYPHGLLDILRDAPPGPWMYTGALENHPNLVRALAEIRPLWGNDANALVRCRSPFVIERLLQDEGLAAPEARGADAERPGYCRWLRKPLAGAAGQGIEFADAVAGPRSPRHYYQQFVPGRPMSAVYVRARGETRLVGVTEQLIGEDWLYAPPFRYAGNVGPVEVPVGFRDELVRIGRVLGDACGLLGIFGVDFVEDDGRPWVVEVNPRYPASVEVLERATVVAALGHHRSAFDPEAPTGAGPVVGCPVAGKAILYSPRRVVMPDWTAGPLAGMLGPAVTGPGQCPQSYADIPHPGEVIEPGWPILTVLGDGNDRSGCLAVLRSRAAAVERAILGTPPAELAAARRLYDRIGDEQSE
ncbi:MAG: ATP-grasp domain-containing protein, partial [Zavarzinella sp.]|nr:ATP-grasp domain-containing protein [Zavarzinella sp.]